jgi:GntR family transcriptional regulator, transcriptional repressor for pyruvate dehydrogenase complex
MPSRNCPIIGLLLAVNWFYTGIKTLMAANHCIESKPGEAMDQIGNLGRRRNLVGETAEELRRRSFAAEPGALLGSLNDLAKVLGVGIVTLQQAARVVEHEGLLTARRGPGGGYHAARPDAAALDRALSSFLRTHPGSFREALNITSLLFTELAAAAARCADARLRDELAQLQASLRAQEPDYDHAAFEHAFQDLLFRMVDWPLFALLTQVTLRLAESSSPGQDIASSTMSSEWRAGRLRIIAAILAGDPDLARFEADRSNRRLVLQRMA